MNTFKKLQQNNNLGQFEEMHHTDSDDEVHLEDTGPQGIIYYNDLKKHPKLLNFTL
jgi:hypothetical protein